jgi:hypothetical protein
MNAIAAVPTREAMTAVAVIAPWFFEDELEEEVAVGDSEVDVLRTERVDATLFTVNVVPVSKADTRGVVVVTTVLDVVEVVEVEEVVEVDVDEVDVLLANV